MTFDKADALRVFKAMRSGGYRQPKLVVNAKNDELEFIGNEMAGTIHAMVLEPGTFTTRRVPFERLLRSFLPDTTITLQSDATDFRIGAFTGQHRGGLRKSKMP